MDRRKELKKTYKDNPPEKGVYQIRNIQNGKVYIEGSMNLHGASNSYLIKLNTNWHPSKSLQDDWNTLGSEAFVFEILETLDLLKYPQEEWRKAVEAMEKQWLDKLKPYDDRGYNKRK